MATGREMAPYAPEREDDLFLDRPEQENPANGHRKPHGAEDDSKIILERILNAETAVEKQWPNWKSSQACEHEDIDRFFPGRGGPTNETKEICLGCEVGSACLILALEAGYDHGLWGGFPEKSRVQLKRILKSGGTWEDVLEIREEAEEDISMTQKKQVTIRSKEKIEEIKTRSKQNGKSKAA